LGKKLTKMKRRKKRERERKMSELRADRLLLSINASPGVRGEMDSGSGGGGRTKKWESARKGVMYPSCAPT